MATTVLAVAATSEMKLPATETLQLLSSMHSSCRVFKAATSRGPISISMTLLSPPATVVAERVLFAVSWNELDAPQVMRVNPVGSKLRRAREGGG